MRESIGLIFQDTSLDERLMTDENLRFHAAIYGLPARVSRERREDTQDGRPVRAQGSSHAHLFGV